VSLTEYQKKRNFKKTPEPKGTLQPAPARPRYVVHRHHATRLHWDVRLEMRGVLASFAVPQGPPLVAGKRRLAVHTEDHPIEYLTFHGVIPDGYGAGTMTIWDQGTYDLLLEKPGSGGKGGEYKIQFHGTRLVGEYVIVQTTAHEGRDWLMIMHGTPPKDDPLDRKIEPMLAITADEPFDSPQFTYEAKWDGVRTLAFVDGGEVRLQTRNLLDCTKQYPEAHGAAEALTGGYQAILDGEVVALDEKGVPSFQRLQPRMHQRDESAVSRLRKSVPIVYEVFDLLYLDGEDLTRRPLRERRQRLEAALEPMGAIRLSEGFPGSGIALFNAVREQGLEGIVAKRLDAPYVSGRSAAWVKVKAFKAMDCVIGGWTAGQGDRHSTLGAHRRHLSRREAHPGGPRRHRLRRPHPPRSARDTEGAPGPDVAVRGRAEGESACDLVLPRPRVRGPVRRAHARRHPPPSRLPRPALGCGAQGVHWPGDCRVGPGGAAQRREGRADRRAGGGGASDGEGAYAGGPEDRRA
jgi:bifunctional non-homologous end joining protein LigD